jgi:hypothetical protein
MAFLCLPVVMRTSLPALFVGIVASLSLAAPAAAAVHETRWTCWLDGETRVACTVIAARDADAAGSPAARGAASADPRQLLQAVRARPASLAGRLVFVPLFNVPFDDSLVEQLVSAVLCGATPDCGARYKAQLQQFIAEAPEQFADMMDPVLAGTAL